MFFRRLFAEICVIDYPRKRYSRNLFYLVFNVYRTRYIARFGTVRVYDEKTLEIIFFYYSFRKSAECKRAALVPADIQNRIARFIVQHFIGRGVHRGNIHVSLRIRRNDKFHPRLF